MCVEYRVYKGSDALANKRYTMLNQVKGISSCKAARGHAASTKAE